MKMHHSTTIPLLSETWKIPHSRGSKATAELIIFLPLSMHHAPILLVNIIDSLQRLPWSSRLSLGCVNSLSMNFQVPHGRNRGAPATYPWLQVDDHLKPLGFLWMSLTPPYTSTYNVCHPTLLWSSCWIILLILKSLKRPILTSNFLRSSSTTIKCSTLPIHNTFQEVIFVCNPCHSLGSLARVKFLVLISFPM